MITIEIGARQSPQASGIVQLVYLTKHNARVEAQVIDEMSHPEARELALAILALTDGDRASPFESATIRDLRQRLWVQAEIISKYQTNPEQP